MVILEVMVLNGCFCTVLLVGARSARVELHAYQTGGFEGWGHSRSSCTHVVHHLYLRLVPLSIFIYWRKLRPIVGALPPSKSYRILSNVCKHRETWLGSGRHRTFRSVFHCHHLIYFPLGWARRLGFDINYLTLRGGFGDGVLKACVDKSNLRERYFRCFIFVGWTTISVLLVSLRLLVEGLFLLPHF